MRYGAISPIAQKQMVLYSGQPVTAQMTRFGRFGANSTTTGAAAGASTGASIASVVPGIGTAVGAILGGIAGGIAGSMNKRDQEVANFDQAVALWQVNPNNIYNIANKYLVLAGLFDLNLRGPHIPIYNKYGHQGEEPFTRDFVRQIAQAAANGQITPNDTPVTIMARVIQPWIDSWGFGPMQDPHADLINKLMIGMIADYVSGSAPQIWRARGGDLPASFASLPPFSLRSAAPPALQLSAPAQPVPLSAAIVTGPLSAPVPVVSTPTAPVTAPTPLAPVPPTTILTADGSTVTAPGNGLRSASGQVFYLGHQVAGDPNNIHGMPVWVSGAQNGYLIGILLANGGQPYGQNADGMWWQWNGHSWFVIPGPPQLNAAPVSAAPSAGPVPAAGSTTVPIPAGYTSIGTDASTGVPVYQGLNGLLYEWNGTTMTPLSGTAVIGGNPFTVASGIVQSQASSGAPPSSGLLSLPAPSGMSPPPPPPDQFTAPAPMQPPMPTPATAGVSSAGLPSWVTWGAVAAGIYLMFGTARPARRHG